MIEKRLIAVERALEALLQREKDMENRSIRDEWYTKEGEDGWY